MTYDWGALVFVERWRRNFARGVVFGMRRPADQTTFELRIQPGEWGAALAGGAVEARLLDVGDLVRERRIPLTATVSVVIQVTTPSVARSDRREKGLLAPAAGGRRVLDDGARLVGEVIEVDGERRALVHVGFPIVVDVTEAGGLAGRGPGDWIEFRVAGTPRGYLIVG